MNNQRVMLVVLSLCILLVVILNMSYLPRIVNVSMEYKTGNLSLDFTSSIDNTKNNKKKNNKKGDSGKMLKENEPSIKQQATKDDKTKSKSKIAGLNCDRFGGPSEEIATEMVYWRDIPKDAHFHSPYASYGPNPKYLTFEPDEGGWNNIRMSMETATALAHAMGRTLVLPPEQKMYLLDKDDSTKNRFTFRHFFPFDAIADEHPSVEVISMDEFLQREVLSGNLKYPDGSVAFPPGNQTIWEGHVKDGILFWSWLRNVTRPPIWDFSKCVVAFAKEPGPDSNRKMTELMNSIRANERKIQDFINHPTPVDGSPGARLQEMLAHRKNICIYDDFWQKSKVMHFMGDNDSGARLLVHFYAFLFFEDWKQDLWTKRYVRDHLRYVDEIQCAAAKIVDAVRQRARDNGNVDGKFDTMHVRRGDFQYKETRIEAEEILENIQDVLRNNTTLFIATDEKQLSFFKPLMDRYRVYFLKDYLHLVPDLNKNYYGMLDQLIASRGDVFFGAYYSTFTGYINRIRGYHSQKDKTQGWKDGTTKSYYYVEKRHKEELINYYPIKGPLWGREFPVSWRLIDHNVDPSSIDA